MSLFHHPHLVRGVVRTPMGAFFITRGIVDAPDDVGESLGWRRVDFDEETTNTYANPRPEMTAASAGSGK